MGNVELISIIIPVYNVAPYLAESLDSAIFQTYKELEIIIIDDGSTDGSGIICDEYAKRDARIRVVHQENRGLSAARNTGLDMMTGDAVVFLDSDDAYHQDYVSTMVGAMNRENADVVICRFTIHKTSVKMALDNKSKFYPTVKNGTYDRDSALRVLVDGAINPGVWNKLYRKRLWDEVRFPVDHVYENIETTFRIFDLCSKTVILDQLLYMYRKRPGAITEVPSKKNINDWVLARSHFEAYIRKNIPEIFSEEDLKRFYRSRINQMISFYCELPGDKKTECLRSELWSLIIDTSEKADIMKCKRSTRIGYWMIRFFPWLLKAIFPWYRWVCQQ